MAASPDLTPALALADLPVGNGPGQVPQASEVHPINYYQSGVVTANGAAQNNAHGLGRLPLLVFVIPVTGNNGAGAAGTQFTAVTYTFDSTNVVVTGTSGGQYMIFAI